MGDNPFEEPPTNQRLLNTGGSRSYGGGGGYKAQEVFGDKYMEAETHTTQESFKPELQFQSFQHTNSPASNRGSMISSGGTAIVQDHAVVDFGDAGHEPLGQGGEGGGEPGGEVSPGGEQPGAAPAVEPVNAKFWTIQFYRPLFNVDTNLVVGRMVRSLLPFKFGFIEAAKANPDFYGPFWIATTLTFILAITGNLYAYFKHYKDQTWQYNFQVIVVGAAVFYGYVIVIPLILWAVLKYLKVPVKPLEIICIYGYCLFIYIPISIVCVVPLSLMQWILTIFACAWSGLFLISNLMAVVKDFALKRGLVVMLVVGGLHVALALTYKLYFFENAYSN